MITTRQQKMLFYLIEKNSFIEIKKLSEEFSISNRTVRHDLLLLEEWLSMNKMELDRHRKYGVKLSLAEEEREDIFSKLSTRPSFLESKERVKIMVKQLLEETEVNVQNIIEEFSISKNTFLQDYHLVREWLLKKKLDASRKQGKILLHGKEKDVRKAYIYLLREEFSEEKIFQFLIRGEEDSAFITLWTNWFPLEDIYEVCHLLQMMEQQLEIEFSDSSFSALTLHILMAVQRLKEGHLIKMNEELLLELKSLKEFSIIKEIIGGPLYDIFHINTPEQEIGYITQHVLGAQRERENLDADQYYSNFSRKVVNLVEARLQQPLVEKNKIIDGLAIHLKPAFYRAKYHLQSENPLLGQIEETYGRLLDILEEETNRLLIEENLPYQFNRHEISYIALHVGSGLNQKVIPLRSKVAIVCSSGIGTSSMLERKLSALYPQTKVTRKYSYKDLKNAKVIDADLILSTIDLPFSLSVPVVHVSPLLPRKDQEKLVAYIGEPRTAIQDDGQLLQVVKEVLTIVKKNATVHQENELMVELLGYFQGQDVQKEKKSLTEFLPPQAIHLQSELTDWRLVVKKGNELLVQTGCTNEAFGDALIVMADQPNNHFVIAEGVAFPHASSDQHVHQTGFSLLTLKKPILFGASHKKVWFILTLAAVDQKQHTFALATLLEVLNDQQCMQLIQQATDATKVWECLLAKEEEG